MRVLLIDDEVMILRVFRRMLEPAHEVVITQGGKDGLSALERGPDYDVIICDLAMPEIDGRDVYEWVKKRAPHLSGRIVFLSGGAFTSRMNEFVTSTDNIFLAKPVTRDVLLNTLEIIAGNETTAFRV